MPDDHGAPIDPRYDPAFQRGFSGEVQTGAHGQSTLRRTAAVNPSPVRPAPQRPDEFRVTPPPAVEAPDSDSVTPQSAGPQSRFAPAGGASIAPTPDVAPVTVGKQERPVGPRELARNPFVIALAALAAVLILAGAIWAYEGFAMIVKNGGTRNEVEFWAAQTMSFGAPLAVVAGLAVVAVLLVIFGRSWHRAATTER
ncbi:MAG: hypothetical protein M3N46_13005 [Actinomycetota bacterium]|nr:hypothetical protein [Actinomycetota bacterium]